MQAVLWQNGEGQPHFHDGDDVAGYAGQPYCKSIREFPLNQAAKNGHLGIVQALLEHGADPNSGGGALFDAVEGGNAEIVKVQLQYGADMCKTRIAYDISGQINQTPLDLATERRGNSATLRELLESRRTKVSCLY